AELDTTVVVKSFREPTRNSPEVIAKRIGAGKAKQYLMPDGGNGPQYLVNRYASDIANNKSQFVLFCGAEAMATGRKLVKETGQQPEWGEASDKDPTYLIADEPMYSNHEKANGMWRANGFYAMSENAMRHHANKSIEAHQLDMGKLFARFTQVAAKSPYAWYPTERTPEEIAWPSEGNRFVAWPYTKYMNAMNQINQSAALLLTSVAQAKRMGVDKNKFIYLHGCADTKELPVATRPNFYTSDAMRVMAEQVFAGNSLTMADISHIDFYSCFPAAVQMARDNFGMAPDDPRSLTVTGGLPFHGGAGSNYVMNSIAATCEKLRDDSGSYGLVTANGGYFSKHAAGIYSTNPTQGEWRRTNPADYQRQIDAIPQVSFTENPEGEATIETYTVFYGRDGQPSSATIVGRLGDLDDPEASRFFSILNGDTATMEAMTKEDMIGAKGRVAQAGGSNRYALTLL
ncbi:MAG: hypothetical protein ACR2PJ_00830, partial [Pseudomonadales bacterium]